MKVIITTTINVPHNLVEWADTLEEGDNILVAGDQKSPHDEIDTVLNDISMNTDIVTEYFTPFAQSEWTSSDVIGWNCIQRRNIALLEAMQLRPDWIITINDDDLPTSMIQFNDLFTSVHHPTPRNTISTTTGWWNPGSQCFPGVVHRGFPLSYRHAINRIELDKVHENVKVGVAEMLIVGDPDVDAIERMCLAPVVEFISSDVVLTPGTWAPFNSEATAIRGELAPLLFQWPGVGRYDDIWASYLARCVMDYFDWSVYYGGPAVRQDRNEHNLLTDLDAELFGMRRNEELIQVLRDVRFHGDITVVQAMIHAVNKVLAHCSWIPLQTRDAFYAWFTDLEKVGHK